MRELGFKLRNGSLHLLLYAVVKGISSPPGGFCFLGFRFFFKKITCSLGNTWGTLPNEISMAVGKQHGERMLEMHVRCRGMSHICMAYPALHFDPSVAADMVGSAPA